MTRASDTEVLIHELEKRWNAYDAAGLAGLFGLDADLLNAFGVAIKGRPAIERFYTALFATVFQGCRLHTEATATRFIRPDVALVDVRWNVTGMATRAERAGPDLNGLMAFVLSHDGQGWEIATMHVMQFPSGQPAV